MAFLRLLLCSLFVFVVLGCGGDPKEEPHDEPTGNEPVKGDVGDSCKKNSDCKADLICQKGFCFDPNDDSDPGNPGNGDSDNENNDENNPNQNDKDQDGPDNHDSDNKPDEDTPNPDKDQDEPDNNDEDTDSQPVYVPECGNGLRDQDEECDNGENNTDESGVSGVSCRTNCLLARCGDGIVDEGESCDDGNTVAGDYCSPDCKTITGKCGDGIQQYNEPCDKATDSYCSDDCTEIMGECGDGIIQPNEACDDALPGVGGGAGIGSYCNINCTQIVGSCGDGRVQNIEECDDGDLNGRYGYCNTTCTGIGEYCGDGIKNGNEVCDDGNEEYGDYCSPDCQTSFGECGDGIIQDFEACDKSNFGEGIGAYCSADCKTSFGECGDGIKQTANCNGETGCVEVAGLNEECDNGLLGEYANGAEYCPYGSSSGCILCSKICRNAPGKPRFCGDGMISAYEGEVCDKANFDLGIGSYCSDDCQRIVGECGDGIVNGPEVCDDGNEEEGDYCSADCKTITGSCGDNVQQPGEECDFGIKNGVMTCPYGTANCEVCTRECKLVNGEISKCGDNFKDPENEFCDNGQNNGKYLIDKPGFCNAECDGYGKGGFCGDGKVQRESCAGYEGECFQTATAEEECDFGSKNGSMSCPYGEKSCDVCTTECKIRAGKTTYCGDGIVNGNESCDEGEGLNGTYGHCNADCNDPNGKYCGDGEINGNEFCDEGKLINGTYGHCNKDCSAIIKCGDGIINGNETCDDGEEINGTYADYAPGHCNANCDGYGAGGYCGDETTNGNEECDEGMNNGLITDCAYGETSCKVCSSRCTLRNGTTSYCGDSLTDSNHETCDDGSTNNGKYGGYCDFDCNGRTPKCGDGNIDTEYGEICDNGQNNGTYSFDKPGYCNEDCKGQGEGGFCGDGVRNGNEICDNGEENNGRYGGFCNATCSGYTDKCGDGKINYFENGQRETCDEGEILNGTYNHCNNECTAILECGDEIIQSDYEQCDNGSNNGQTDCAYGEEASCVVCTTLCTIDQGATSYCGDGLIDSENGEICDDGESLNGSYGGHCNENCNGYTAKCGDGNIDTEYDEVCDSGQDNGKYGYCATNCSGILRCGDGMQTHTEFCDEGESVNGTYSHCTTDCSDITGRCGDGILQKEVCTGEPGCIAIPDADEECDNGYQNDPIYHKCDYGNETCDVCNTSCQIIQGQTAYCGDGIVQNEYGESCDEGKAVNGTFNHCDEDCTGIVDYRCGDGIVNGKEECDNGDDNGKTECDYGLQDCEVCTTSCTTNQGITSYCGDGRIDSENHEICDGANTNGQTGVCGDFCRNICGNGSIEEGEACDDGANNGKYGKCNATCSQIVVHCGDGKIQKQNAGQCEIEMCSDEITTNCCEIIEFADGDLPENCDEGEENNGYHGHCNEICQGISSCGDNSVGKDEICEPGDLPNTFECNLLPQFQSGTISTCDDNCTPDISDCVNNTSFISPFLSTFQNKCYNATTVISCPESGDFYGQPPQFNFTTQNFVPSDSNMTITETGTELIWQTDTPANYSFEKDGEIYYYCNPDTSCTLAEAENYCRSLVLDSLRNWRLPTAEEIAVIADYSRDNHIHEGFTGVRGAYWTSEGLVFSTTDGTLTQPATPRAQVKCVNFDDKNSCSFCSKNRENMYFEESIVLSIFTSNQSDSFAFWYHETSLPSMSWKDALAYCKTIDKLGLDKFRLPTVNELINAMNSTRNGSIIPGVTSAWTSNTLSTDPSKAYIVDFEHGTVNYDSKTNNRTVICVE